MLGLKKKVIKGFLDEIKSGNLQFNIVGEDVVAVYKDPKSKELSEIFCGKVTT